MKPLIAGLFIIVFISSCRSSLKELTTKRYNDSLYQQFWTASWSYNDKYVAIGGVDSILRIYYAPSLKLFKSYPIKSWIHNLKWHPRENLLAIATLDNFTQLLNLENGSISILDDVSSPKVINGYKGSRAIGWNNKGSLLAVGGLDGVIRLWNKQGKLISWVSDTTGAYLALDWHPTKNLFVACNSEINIYDSLLTKVRKLKHPNEQAIILSTDWHPSGRFFVIGDYGHNWEGENVPSLLHFWTHEGVLLKTVAGSIAEYRTVSWNQKGSRLATASDILRIWGKDGTLLHTGTTDGSNFLWGLSWNSKGNKLVTSSRHKTIALWNKKARLLKRIEL